MGRPQEMQLDGEQDIAAPFDVDQRDTIVCDQGGKDAAAVISMPLALGNGGSKEHLSAEPAEVVPTENGDHSSAAKEEIQEEPAGPDYEKTEVCAAEIP